MGYLSVGVSRKGYTSKPPVPEERKVNRLHGEAMKKQKDATEAAAARKTKRKEKHEKECKIARTEGKSRPATPESTEEEDSSDAKLNFSDDDEAATGAGSPPVYRGAGDRDVPVTLGEARLTSGSLVDPPLARTERRSPTLAAGRGSPTPAAGRRSSTPVTGQRSPPPATGRRTPTPAVSTGGGGSVASAETPAQTASRRQTDPRVAPSGPSSGGVSVPRARRSGSGKRSMSARRSGSGKRSMSARLGQAQHERPVRSPD
ncbi:flocculation protein FLO11-like [Panicum virgatum]|uniref:flocculation protein FLO11-like n=1 Tax=Panicum virgatum TaxID=38727 RepID=UPI0019D5E9DF|nr:flocculation protein FLO11-like [Panicum virgatum]